MCGAGASSTFVAGRLRRAAQAAGLDWEVTAAALDGVDPFADVILLGPHIADRREEIGRSAPRARIFVLPEDAFTDLDGTRIRALVLAGSAPDGDETATPKGTP
jgi:PTS system cellobiose-specific IIB component